MLGKILLTALVIAVAILMLRQRTDPAPPQAKSAAQDAATASASNDLRIAAYLFLILMFGAGAVLYYQRWQDRHQILTITLYRDGAAPPVHYQVYKFQLGERTFVTLDGIQITVAANERMEVTGLD